MPVVFATSDDNILFVGRKDSRELKLPDTRSIINEYTRLSCVQERVQELGRFAFAYCGLLPNLNYMGIIRHKPVDKTLIIPVVVDLDEISTSRWLARSEEWATHVVNNPDHVWYNTEELDCLLYSEEADMLTSNTAAIVKFYMNSYVGQESIG